MYQEVKMKREFVVQYIMCLQVPQAILLHDFNDDDDTLENLLNRIKTIAFSSKNYYSYFNRP